MIDVEDQQKASVDEQRQDADDQHGLIGHFASHENDDADHEQNEDENQKDLNEIHLHAQDVVTSDEGWQEKKKFDRDQDGNETDLKETFGRREIAR